MTIFRELLKLFRGRFLEADALAQGSDYSVQLSQLLGILAAPGLLVSLLLLPEFLALRFRSTAEAEWLLRSFRLFFTAWSFSVTGFAAIFEWDTLFPDKRDFLVLTPLPIRMRDLFAAKLASLGVLMAVVTSAVNAAPVMLLFRLTAISCLAASAFAFFAVAAVQGILINLLSPQIFRRISPLVQLGGMSLMIMSLLLFPLYSNVKYIATLHPGWLWYFPPYWFAATQEVAFAHPDSLFRALGMFGWKALACAVGLFCAAWSAGFRRHYRRTLEAEDTRPKAQRIQRTCFSWMLRSPQERAAFYFSGATLARSAKHRLFLSAYLSVGVAFGLLVMVTIRNGVMSLSPEGVRAFPLLVTFFVISGLRAGFQFPAELAANWVFQIAESNWGPAARKGARKRVLVSGLMPSLLLFLPLEIYWWGLWTGCLHILFQAMAGALLIELLFWNFEKVPFTCSYFPGRLNLALLATAYLYGFTNYSFTMSDLELSLEHSMARAVLVSAVAMAALAFLWRRKSKDAPVVFEASEPEIQLLNLN